MLVVPPARTALSAKRLTHAVSAKFFKIGIRISNVVVSNLYSHDSQWPIRDNSAREENDRGRIGWAEPRGQ